MRDLKNLWVWALVIGAFISILVFSLMAKKIDYLKHKLYACEFQKENLITSINEQNKQIDALKLNVKDFKSQLQDNKKQIITKIQAVPMPSKENECESTLRYVIELQELQ